MKLTRLLCMMLLLMVGLSMKAQTLVSGVVKDQQTGRPLSHVSIVAEGTKTHVVSNEEGRFTLKTARQPKYLHLSHLGYKKRKQPLEVGKTENIEILMASSSVELSEVVVSLEDPTAIVKAAISRIERNYPQEKELVRCFYRETARKGSRFISVAEAVTEMYKTDYSLGAQYDAVSIQKGRRLMSLKARDTLGVKIQGGPVAPLMADVAKNRDYLLDDEALGYYDMHLKTPVRIDDRLHYVVSLEPRQESPVSLMGGELYIDQESLTITRAELQLDLRDWRKAADYMLIKKPTGLRFRPKKLSMTVVYNTDADGVTRLSYIRNEMRFNCDWKRRLFASSFTLVSETVVTEYLQHGKDVKRPRGRSSFNIRDRFYDKVEYFNDPSFWADYNIIEPTESLEHAINKLKKKVGKD